MRRTGHPQRPAIARRFHLSVLLALALVASVVGSRPHLQAEEAGCKRLSYPDPPREVWTCDGGLTITAERRTKFRLLDVNADGRPEGAELESGGLLMDGPPPAGGNFQILTPHAIAAVRGTVWAVDVVPGRTSVFVSRGIVSVTAGGDAPRVELRAGDGVDVEPGQPYKTKKWSAERVRKLFARFGR